MNLQKTEFAANLERLLFNMSDDVVMHNSKRELFLQSIRAYRPD